VTIKTRRFKQVKHSRPEITAMETTRGWSSIYYLQPTGLHWTKISN